jgi:hypothetical protein
MILLNAESLTLDGCREEWSFTAVVIPTIMLPGGSRVLKTHIVFRDELHELRCPYRPSAIHIAIHNNVVYDVLPMTCGAVRALPCP